jgi:uncharacterized MAPEG superfamily protein
MSDCTRFFTQGVCMGNEIVYLSLYGVLVLATVLAQVLAALLQVGLPTLAGNREELLLTGVAGRLERSVNNAVVALAMVAPAVFAVTLTQTTSAHTASAVLVFLIARLAYAVIYAFGIPYLRTLTWLVGFGCTLFLYTAALGV